MATAPFKVIDAELKKEELKEGNIIIDKILSHLRPEWFHQDIKVKELTGGLLNSLMCFHLADDKAMRDGVVVRTYISEGEARAAFFKRHTEFLALQLAVHAGCSQPILATFLNGVVYRFAPGRTLVGSDVHNPLIIRAVARCLAQLHTVDLSTPLWDMQGKPATFPGDHTYFSHYRQAFSTCPETLNDPHKNQRYQEECHPPSYWRGEFDELEKLCTEIKPTYGLGHYDAHILNVIYDDVTETASLIDFEFSCVGPVLTDVCAFYLDKVYRDMTDDFRDVNEPEVTSEDIALWQREYLTRRYELQGRDSHHVTEYDLEKFRLESAIMEMAYHMMWVMACTGFIEIDTGWPMFDIIKLAGENYHRCKSRLPQMKQRYLSHIKK